MSLELSRPRHRFWYQQKLSHSSRSSTTPPHLPPTTLVQWCRAYYGLCHDRKSLLHRCMPKHINQTPTTWVITETSNIAEGIRAMPASSSSHEDLMACKKTLEFFELLSMDINFLHKYIDDLHGLLVTGSLTNNMSKARGVRSGIVGVSSCHKKVRGPQVK